MQTALALALHHVTHGLEQFAVFAFIFIRLDGVDQAAYEGMGYVIKSKRKSGLHRTAAQPAANPLSKAA